ncbi:glycosyltransferase family 2 protein [Anabaena sp. FACHB-1250]|uniref:glycosyltransferase family 2 protein n=1 Tax=Anabaena sp. FACHB-1250 TaxID=2692770 RepID=UPI0016814A17|nr:glycosyltransferase family A protein [Anabaena sp. FACHB-1250]MBD2140407.1 glycosyltransferase family 2 protein [Anabaena sp. FACHB-1250]
MNSSLVSILIPAYNAAPYIAETLDSALAQTWQNIEIVVVDDGSTDNTLAIAKTYESKRVKVISQENKGASTARNRALKAAQGDFIQYLDADDLLAPDKIERQIKLIEQGYEEYIIAGEWGRFYTSPLEANFIKEKVWQDMTPVKWLVCSWEGGGMMHPAAWLVPRNISDSAGVWNENVSLNDDGEYFCRVILASQGVKFCTGTKSYYRSGIFGNLSGSKSRKAWESAFLSAELCTNNLLSVENNDRTRYACACYWQRFVFMAYPQAQDLIQNAEKNVRSLGGCDLKPEGGIMFKVLREVLGWKIAMQLQKRKRLRTKNG